VRELAPFVLLACACAAATERREAPRAATPEPAAPVEAVASPVESFDDLLNLGASVAPGMRAAARRSSAGDAVDLVHAEGSDLCLRAAFASTTAASASLVSGTGEVLATVGKPSAAGILPEHGPLCVRKGDSVRAVAQGAGHVRWVAWVADP
jgi:hypothetical protein